MSVEIVVTDQIVEINEVSNPVEISVSAGAVVAPVWGGITGTLSNQTDLQNALNAKFDDPTGTTAQYLRGDGTLATFPTITSGTVTSVGLTMPSAFSVANSPVTSSGTLAVTGAGDTTQYIAGDGSLVAFPIAGQSGTLVREVRNVTGATLTKGTVVYINGASGNKPTVAKAIATTDATSAQTFGLIQADIPNNSNGYLVAFGDLDGLNTSAFAEGVQLYLSATTAGTYTSVKQYAPNHLVYIGVVTRQHVNQGRIEVRIQNGYELDELHDVAAQTPTNNDGLFYNSTNSLWENKSIPTALGYTPISGTGTSGQVAYFTGASTQAGSNNLFWDATNFRLGIGTNAPQANLSIKTGGTGNKHIEFSGTAGVNYIESLDRSSANAPLIIYSAQVNSYLGFTIGSTTERMRLHGTGNLVLGGTVASDSGQRLQVTGDTLLKGSGNTSATTALLVENSDGSDLFIARNDGSIFLTSNTGARIYPSIALSGVEIGATGLAFDGRAVTRTAASSSFWFFVANNSTAATQSLMNFQGGFTPTSGTATWNSTLINTTINQTGGANGITRGLYVNPTLTAAADWRSIEWSNNTGWGLYGVGTSANYLAGRTSIGVLPTTIWNQYSAVLQVGQLWLLDYQTGTTGELSSNSYYDGTNNRALRTGGAGSITFQSTHIGLLTAASVSAGAIQTLTEKARLTNSGNLLIGSTTDSGEKLQVTGTAKITGASTFSTSVTSPYFIATGTLPAHQTNAGVFQYFSNGVSIRAYGATAGTGFIRFLTGGGGGSADTEVMRLDESGNLCIGVTSGGDFLNIAASTTAKAQINLAAGTAPTSPNDGDIWFDGTNLKMQIGGVTKTFTLT